MSSRKVALCAMDRDLEPPLTELKRVDGDIGPASFVWCWFVVGCSRRQLRCFFDTIVGLVVLDVTLILQAWC